MLLGGLFVAFLVTCNLIVNKFVKVYLPFREDAFVVSAAIAAYPVTFLITDLLSEFYGKKKTAFVVFTGFVASIFVLLVLSVAGYYDAASFSPVSNGIFDTVFGNNWRVIGSSMAAYLSAQFLDIKLFEFWKKKTNGKHLWVRNNFSTIFSQLLDSFLVSYLLLYGTDLHGEINNIAFDNWVIKILCALIDTPIIYVSVFLIRKYFKLKPGEEVQF